MERISALVRPSMKTSAMRSKGGLGLRGALGRMYFEDEASLDRGSVGDEARRLGLVGRTLISTLRVMAPVSAPTSTLKPCLARRALAASAASANMVWLLLKLVSYIASLKTELGREIAYSFEWPALRSPIMPASLSSACSLDSRMSCPSSKLEDRFSFFTLTRRRSSAR